MSAPKGNQFWKNRSKHGRDRLFETPQLLLDAAFEYFQWCDDNPWKSVETIQKGIRAGENGPKGMVEETSKVKPIARPYTIEGLTLYVNATLSWWRQFKRNLKPEENNIDKDFLTVIEEIEQIIYQNQLEGATIGTFNANIVARKLGLVDKTENKNVNINREAKELSDDEIKKLNDDLENEY